MLGGEALDLGRMPRFLVGNLRVGSGIRFLRLAAAVEPWVP